MKLYNKVELLLINFSEHYPELNPVHVNSH